MNHQHHHVSVSWLLRVAATLATIAAMVACTALRPNTAPPPSFYSLDGARRGAGTPLQAGPGAPTLLVLPPRAAAGFDSPRILYLRQAQQVEYFAHSEWVDAPARMFNALLVQEMQGNGAFRAVALSSGAAAGDLRLDTEIVRLQHEFLQRPSVVRFTLRATLVDDRTRRILAWREFDTVAPAASDDPYGGVMAAHQAVHTALGQLSAFCIETLARRPAPP